MTEIEIAQELVAVYAPLTVGLKRSTLTIDGLLPECNPLADELCLRYSDASPEVCAAVRQAIQTNPVLQSNFLGNIYRCAAEIHQPSDLDWLRRGLSSASIENCSSDFRDLYLALGELYLRAEDAGIDPKPEFQAIAVRSGQDKSAGGSDSTSNMLRTFHSTASLAWQREYAKQPKENKR